MPSSLKRKRPHEAARQSPPSEHDDQPSSTVTRRATRQSASTAPLVFQADPEPRRRRRRTLPPPSESHDGDDDENDGHHHPTALQSTSNKRATGKPPQPQRGRRRSAATTSTANLVNLPPAPGRAREHRPVKLRSAIQPDHVQHPALDHLKPDLSNKTLRHHPPPHDGAGHHDPRRRSSTNHLALAPMPVESPANARPVGSAAGPTALEKHHPPRRISITATVPIMTQAQPRSARTSDHIAANTNKPFAPATTTNPPKKKPPSKPARKQQPAKHSQEPKKSTNADRNIDKVVFGNICFSTWYHSPYGTEALGDIPGGVPETTSIKEEGPWGLTSKKTKEDKLDRLYVCPCCFKYSKELVPWWQHVHWCERRGYIPGEKIYTHPKQRRQPPVRQQATDNNNSTSVANKGPGRKRKHSDAPVVDAAIITADSAAGEGDDGDGGEWSIWQVDGEKDVLFCQNLSLFAKLFLDNKSVFFDVNSFHYFLLVHTAPRRPPPPSPPPSDDPPPQPPLPPRKHQIVGFFSKEKLSWDNNNLACILVFPPWQRKGLGVLLMAVSYEISKREGMLGGPEKPISDLGKKGYKRFWAGEIARWLLGLDTTTTTSGGASSNGGGGSDDEEEEEEQVVVVDVEDCSKATWIVPEDCLAMLKEMGVVQQAGLGPPKPKRRDVVSPAEDDPDDDEAAADDDEVVVAGAADGEEDDQGKVEVPRVRVSKDDVRKWVEANHISLEKACDPDGFVEGYAVKQSVVTDEEEV